MNNINFLLNDLNASQLSYFLIRESNKYISSDLDIIIFFNDISKVCVKPNFALMGMQESFGVFGPTVATCCKTAATLINNIGQSKREKYFYVWDLEWLRGQQKVFDRYKDIYWHPHLQLIARSEEHKKIIENCWNRKVVGICDDFSFEDFKKIIRS